MESYCIFSKQRDCTVCLVLGLEKKQESHSFVAIENLPGSISKVTVLRL